MRGSIPLHPPPPPPISLPIHTTQDKTKNTPTSPTVQNGRWSIDSEPKQAPNSQETIYLIVCKITVPIIMYICNTVQPRLSGPRLSGTSIIRTSRRPENTLPRMRRRCDQ